MWDFGKIYSWASARHFSFQIPWFLWRFILPCRDLMRQWTVVDIKGLWSQQRSALNTGNNWIMSSPLHCSIHISVSDPETFFARMAFGFLKGLIRPWKCAPKPQNQSLFDLNSLTYNDPNFRPQSIQLESYFRHWMPASIFAHLGQMTCTKFSHLCYDHFQKGPGLFFILRLLW